jgi:hypothetical protein
VDVKLRSTRSLIKLSSQRRISIYFRLEDLSPEAPNLATSVGPLGTVSARCALLQICAMHSCWSASRPSPVPICYASLKVMRLVLEKIGPLIGIGPCSNQVEH